MNYLIRHLTVKVSHEDATSLLTETFIPPPFSAETYFSKVTDFSCTCVPSYISISINGSAETITKTQKTKNKRILKIKQENLERKLTSMSPLGMPSKSEGLIQPSTTNHPPKFTPLTLESPCNPSTWINNYNI